MRNSTPSLAERIVVGASSVFTFVLIVAQILERGHL